MTYDKYSFFVAGHTYGNPGVVIEGLYPAFKDQFSIIKQEPEMKLGVFTGDVVRTATEENWDAVDIDIDSLGVPVLIAVGNHDMYNRYMYESRYGKTYFDTIVENDLFIVLDPNISGWNISGNQLDFLSNSVSVNYKKVNNIFVFFHQLLWKTSGRYRFQKPNSAQGKADTVNFWSEIEPIFHNLPNEVVMFAGDVGAGSWSENCMFDNYDNITLISSGMGEGDGDNFIIVTVKSDKEISYKLIALQGEINSLGEIEDHQAQH